MKHQHLEIFSSFFMNNGSFGKKKKSKCYILVIYSFPCFYPADLRDTQYGAEILALFVALPVISHHGLFHPFFDSFTQQTFNEHLSFVRHSGQKNPQSWVAYRLVKRDRY